jgi:hypothetical protein
MSHRSPGSSHWEMTDHPTDAQVAALRQQLGQYNASTVHIDEGQDLAVFVHAPDGELIGGIVGWAWKCPSCGSTQGIVDPGMCAVRGRGFGRIAVCKSLTAPSIRPRSSWSC